MAFLDGLCLHPLYKCCEYTHYYFCIILMSHFGTVSLLVRPYLYGDCTEAVAVVCMSPC